jgi:putative ABC transport system substrate-binding protein
VRIEYRWAAGNADLFHGYAAELVAFLPGVILASTSPAVAELQQTTRTVPIVFVIVIDPVGAGFVASLARPGGNVTGFTLFEYGASVARGKEKFAGAETQRIGRASGVVPSTQ